MYKDNGTWFFTTNERNCQNGTKSLRQRIVTLAIKEVEKYYTELEEEKKVESAEFRDLGLLINIINTERGIQKLKKRLIEGR